MQQQLLLPQTQTFVGFFFVEKLEAGTLILAWTSRAWMAARGWVWLTHGVASLQTSASVLITKRRTFDKEALHVSSTLLVRQFGIEKCKQTRVRERHDRRATATWS